MWIEEALYASTGMENQRQSVSTGCEVKQRLELKVVVVVDDETGFRGVCGQPALRRGKGLSAFVVVDQAFSWVSTSLSSLN